HIRAQQHQLGVARAQIPAHRRERARIGRDAPVRWQETGDQHDEQNGQAPGGEQPEPTSSEGAGEPVLPRLDLPSRMQEVDVKARIQKALRARPTAWRNCGPADTTPASVGGASTGTAAKGSTSSGGSPRPRRSAIQRVTWGTPSAPPTA